MFGFLAARSLARSLARFELARIPELVLPRTTSGGRESSFSSAAPNTIVLYIRCHRQTSITQVIGSSYT